MSARARGFTLVESLVALVLLSLGLLGAWGMLLASLAGHAEARRFAAATNLERDMADRIRANPRAGAHFASGGDDALDAGCDAPETCDVVQRAAADVAQLNAAARAQLSPGAVAIIEYEPAIGPAAADRYAITLRWRGPRDDVSVSMHMLAPPVAGGGGPTP